jgi:thioredoxin reductase (NADPH)
MSGRWRWLLAGWGGLAVLAFLVVPRSSYQPGKLLAAHSHFDTKCAGCHRPWHPVDNAACITCHGDFGDNGNPHAGYDVFDDKEGLIADRHLVTFKDNLSCLSCHSEHRGREVDVRAQAAFACTWCHEHPAIRAVDKHQGATLARHQSANQMFKRPFNHYQHRLLMAMQSSNFPQGFDCVSCHQVTPAAPGEPDRMAIAWHPCGFCHVSPQEPALALPAALGKSPAALPYSGVVRTLHINAVFNHSRGHLQTPCAQCHVKVSESAQPDDANSLLITQCFTCHAHQEPVSGPLRRAETSGAEGKPITGLEGIAFAGEVQARVVACGQCHLFHFHGALPIADFSKPALKQPPGRAGGFPPWAIGAIAAVMIGICGIAYTVFVPAEQEHHGAVMETAPQRIIETPVLDDMYQTSIKGLYIIGELGGTASINLAMRSGRQVVEAIAESLRHSPEVQQPGTYDVLIVGCGPAGLGATATAKARGLNYVTLERMTPASTLRSYPRAKFVQATPIDILEYGSFFLEGDSSREDLIREWEKIISQAGLVIQDREEVVAIEPHDGYFNVRTAQEHEFKTRCVVLAIGLRGHPRRLNVPGEAAGRVHYQLIEPDDFRNQRILVVGGGNAGAEVTQALAAPHLGNQVAYSIRDAVLTKVTHENGEKIIALQREGAITFHAASEIKEIRDKSVILKPVKGRAAAPDGQAAGEIELDNDMVFAMLGAELPTRFLESIGITMEIKHR